MASCQQRMAKNNALFKSKYSATSKHPLAADAAKGCFEVFGCCIGFSKNQYNTRIPSFIILLLIYRKERNGRRAACFLLITLLACRSHDSKLIPESLTSFAAQLPAVGLVCEFHDPLLITGLIFI